MQINFGGASKDGGSSGGSGQGCLTVFGGIFALAGLAVGVWAMSGLWLWFDSRDWVPVQATILSADLQVNSDSDGTTYQALATYRYNYQGQDYQSDRVGVMGGADNIGDYHQNTHRRLQGHLDAGTTTTAWVDPDDPGSALLVRDMRWSQFLMMMLFPILFGGIGILIIWMGRIGGRKLRHENEQASLYPAQPWMWRELWADGIIRGSAKHMMWFSLFFAVVWNLISAPLLFFLPDEIINKQNYPALLGLLFPLVGIGLAVWAWKSWQRVRRYGVSELRLKTFPVPLGGRMAADLVCAEALPTGLPLTLKLSCIRQRQSGSGKNRSTSETFLWQDEYRTTIPGLPADTPGRQRVPLEFVLPAGQPVSDWEGREKIIWRLNVSEEDPSVSWSAEFELPVFDLGPQPETRDGDQPGSQQQALAGEPGDWTLTGVRHELTGSGHRYYFPPGRNLGFALVMGLFFLLSTGVGIGLSIAAHWIFGIVFVGVGLLMGLVTAALLFQRSVVLVRRDELEVRSGILRLGKPTTLASFQVKSLGLKQTGRANDKLYYDLVAHRQTGKDVKLAYHIAGRRDCQALLDRIGEQFGLETS